MTTVYVVTSGEYLDYRINAVYDDKKLAEKAAAIVMGDVEEWTLNEDKFKDKAASGLLFFHAIVHTKISAEKELQKKNRRVNPGDVVIRRTRPYRDETIEFHPSHSPFADDSAHIYYLWANDEDHAKKVVAERHAKYVATRDELDKRDGAWED